MMSGDCEAALADNTVSVLPDTVFAPVIVCVPVVITPGYDALAGCSVSVLPDMDAPLAFEELPTAAMLETPEPLLADVPAGTAVDSCPGNEERSNTLQLVVPELLIQEATEP